MLLSRYMATFFNSGDRYCCLDEGTCFVLPNRTMTAPRGHGPLVEAVCRALGLGVCAVALGCGPSKFPETSTAPGYPSDVNAVLYLIGDAGLAKPETPNIINLRQEVAQRSKTTRVVVAFLGDNIYEHGLHPPSDPSYEQDVAYLEAQIDVVRGTSAKGVFLPGNHDWGYGGERGAEQVRRQGDYLAAVAEDGVDVRLMPPAVCPGPEVLAVGDLALLVIVETDLWLRGDAPGDHCENGSSSQALESLAEVLRENAAGANRYTIVLGHHPLKTYGSHGGYFGLKDQFFPGTNLWKYLYIPLPFLYPIARNSGVSSQDMSSSKNERMREGFAAVFQEFPDHPLVWAAGHDHTLQVFDGGEYHLGYILVSGTGSRLKNVGWDDALYATGGQQRELGYMRLEFFKDARVLLTVVTDGTASCDDSIDCAGRSVVRYWRWLAGPGT